MFEFGSCIVIPQDKVSYGIRVKIGEYQYEVEKPVHVGHNYNRFDHKTSKPQEFKFPYKTIEEMPDVFIYLT